MDAIGSYSLKPFSKSRKNITLILAEGKRKHVVYAFLELDVTDAREKIHQMKKQAKDISFTGWLVKCVGQTASEHKELNCYRQGRHKIIEFEDVDIPVTVERNADEELRPIPYIIRKVNEKSSKEITQEIRSVQQKHVSKKTQIMGLTLSKTEQLVLSSPQFIKKMVLMILRHQGKLKKKYMGTIGVTSIGMLGKFPGWVIPLGGPLNTLVAVGGITKKPGIVQDKTVPREYLHVTIAVDHDLVDGGPLARFVNRFTELVENASFLETS